MGVINQTSTHPNLFQINKAALEQSKDSWLQYQVCMNARYLPDQLVFVDKSSSDHHIHCHYGCLLNGEWAHKKSIFLCGTQCFKWFGCRV